MTDPNLTGLNSAVRRAAEAEAGLVRARGSHPVLPLTAYLDDSGTRAVWNVVGLLAAREPDVYNGFVGERYLFETIVECADAQMYGFSRTPARTEPLSTLEWAGLLDALQEQIDRVWLIAVPLANFQVPARYLVLTDDVGLAAADQDREWRRWDPAPDIDPFAMQRHFGGRINPGMRWRRVDDEKGGRLDTRRTGVLAIRQRGASTLAFDRALTRAHYALAMWTVLCPPQSAVLWPTTAAWEPRPFVRHGVPFMSLDERHAPTHNRRIYEYAMYAAPDDLSILRAPFAAVDAARDATSRGSLHARAALAAASCVYTIRCQPHDLLRTDELLHLQAAIEAISDDDNSFGGSAGRWSRLTETLGVWQELRGYGRRELDEARRLARDMRNIAAHGSDHVLLNLGYPPDRVRRVGRDRMRTGSDLATARLSAAGPVLLHAVEHVALALAQRGAEEGWDDSWYVGLMTTCNG